MATKHNWIEGGMHVNKWFKNNDEVKHKWKMFTSLKEITLRMSDISKKQWNRCKINTTNTRTRYEIIGKKYSREDNLMNKAIECYKLISNEIRKFF